MPGEGWTLETLHAHVEQRLDAMDKATALQGAEVLRRLDALNHVHERSDRVQNTYLPREVFDAFAKEQSSKADVLAAAIVKSQQDARTLAETLAKSTIGQASSLSQAIDKRTDAMDDRLGRVEKTYLPREVHDGYLKEQSSKADVLAAAIVKSQQDARTLAETLAKTTIEQAGQLSSALDKRTDAVDGRLSRVEKTYLPREVFDTAMGAWAQWRGQVDLKLQALEVSDSERLRLAGKGDQSRQLTFAVIFGVIGALVGVVGLVLALTQ